MVCIGKNIANCSKNPQSLPVMCALYTLCVHAVRTVPTRPLWTVQLEDAVVAGHMDRHIAVPAAAQVSGHDMATVATLSNSKTHLMIGLHSLQSCSSVQQYLGSSPQSVQR